MTVVVIPAFRAAATIVDVVSGALGICDAVVVVDDCCPQGSGDLVRARFAHDRRVRVVAHVVNRGVGGAMKTGFSVAYELGAEYIVKIDADGQMDPRYVPDFLRILDANPKIAFVKGNRFLDSSVARVMPSLRLFGNSVLTLLVRIASGYWSSIDPTNGFFAVRARSLRRIDHERLAERYYFEISLLCALGKRKTEIAEVEIPAIYTSAESSLRISAIVVTFPIKLLVSFVKRVLWQYLIADMNVGSLLVVTGLLLLSLSVFFGTQFWLETIRSGIPRTPGTVVLALAPLIMGFQLLLNALMYDVQFSGRVAKFASDDLTLRPASPRQAVRSGV